MELRQANEFTVKEIPELTDIFHYSEANGHRVRMSWAKFNEYIDGRVAPAYSRASHTGTQPASTISDFDAAADIRVAPAFARANHTGTQLAATISDFSAAVDAVVAPAYSPIGHTHTLANITDAGTAAALNTGLASGNIPVLQAGGKLHESVIPALAVSEYMSSFADLATALADAGVQASQRGDWFNVDDDGSGSPASYFVTTDNPTLSGHVTKINSPTGGVTTLAALTDVATLTANGMAYWSGSELRTDGPTWNGQTFKATTTNNGASGITFEAQMASGAAFTIRKNFVTIDDQLIGGFEVYGENSVAADTFYGAVRVRTNSVASGNESSMLEFWAREGGSQGDKLVYKSNEWDFRTNTLKNIAGMNFNSTGDPELLINTSKVDGRAELSFENDARKYTWRLSSDDGFELYDRTAIARRLRLTTDGVFNFESNTIKNARVEPNVQTIASAATVTPDATIDDMVEVTALAVALTINAPTGTALNGQSMIFKIKDNNISQTLTWNIAYREIGTVLPPATTAGKQLYVSCIRNSGDAKWDVIGVTEEL